MTGPALVLTRDGSCYVGDAEVTDGTVTMPAGKLRVRDLCGTRTYSPKARSIPLRQVREVRWLDADRDADRERVAA